MNDRLELLSQGIQNELPAGFESGYREHKYGGVDFYVFQQGREVAKATYDLDELEDFTDQELVQFVLREFRHSKRQH